MLIDLREERPEDVAAIRDVNRRAFGQDQEANIVDALRSNGAALLSLVATVDDRIVGHIMYCPIVVGELTGAVFMVLVLKDTKMHGVSGLAKYRHEFSTVI